MRRLLLILALLLAACESDGSGSNARTDYPPPDRVTGIITEIDFEDDRVVGFFVETRTGDWDVRIDPDRDYGFNLKHLEQHRARELPVDVPVEQRGDELYAIDILDA